MKKKFNVSLTIREVKLGEFSPEVSLNKVFVNPADDIIEDWIRGDGIREFLCLCRKHGVKSF